MNKPCAEHASDAIKSFYYLISAIPTGAACRGTACFVARKQVPKLWQEHVNDATIYCLGRCYEAPAVVNTLSRPKAQSFTTDPCLLLRQYDYGVAVKKALAMSPDSIISAIDQSQLRGRGGAGFPTGRKWRMVREATDTIKYLVVNADEGDPGAFSDRFLIEEKTDLLIEGLSIAARATGALRCFIYLRTEYSHAKTTLDEAIRKAHSNGLLDNVEAEVFVGKGSYVCGEETALLNSIEGKRPEVRCRPPYPAQQGLWDKPTLVNNVETLCTVPWIINHGADAYARRGFSKSRGTKLICLNSLFRNPGVYEVEFGVSLRQICDDFGGGLKEGTLKGIIVGGPLAGIIPPHLLDTRLGFEEMEQIGASVGHGGIVAFDEHTAIGELTKHVLEFSGFESCGKCTPCRLIPSQALKRLQDNRLTKDQWDEWVLALEMTSLCGLGSGTGAFLKSIAQYYQKELMQCLR